MQSNNEPSDPKTTEDISNTMPTDNTASPAADQSADPTPETSPDQPSKQKGGGKKVALIIGLVVLAIIIAGAIFYLLSANKNTATPEPQVNVEVNKETNNTTVETPEQKPQEISLTAIAPYTGSASATRLFANNQFTHTITMTTKDPAAGKFYEGWLVKKTPSLTFISTGKLAEENGVWKLNFISPTNYMEYGQVVVTEESAANGLDNKPEAHVFEGDF